MQAKTIAEALDLDDLVFENRNKSYGAYEIRKHYNDRITASFGMAVILFISLLWILRPETRPDVLPSNDSGDILHPDVWVIPELPFQPSHPASSSHSVHVRQPQPTPPESNTPPQIVSGPVQPAVTPATPAENPGPVETPGTPTETGKPGTGLGTAGANDLVSSTGETGFKDFADVAPEFPGGYAAMEKYLRNNIEYPTFAMERGVQGTIVIVVKISALGDIVDAQVAKGIGYGCDDEALRVVKSMPRWSPGKNNGHPVPVRCTIRVRMALAQ